MKIKRVITLAPIHAGEVLQAEFLEPFQLTQYRLAKALGISARRINEIIHGSRGITADTALRLSKFFNVSAEFWLNLQTHYELAMATVRLADELEDLPTYASSAMPVKLPSARHHRQLAV